MIKNLNGFNFCKIHFSLYDFLTNNLCSSLISVVSALIFSN